MSLKSLIQAPGGSGTVTSVSVATANGLAGTVATATTTPAITLSTTVTGVLKGNGTTISAATPGTDYVTPNSSPTFATVTLSGAALSQKPVVANSGSAYTIDQANGAQFDITLNAATPVLTLQSVTASESEILSVTLIQDGTGSRVPTWANVTWAAGTAPTVSSAAASRTYLSFVSDGTTWTGYAIAQSTGAGSVVLATSPTITTPLLASGFSSTPTDSHTATTAFGTSLTLGTALQNTAGYDILVNIVLSVTVAASATVVMGIGPTSTPTTDTAISTFSITGDFTLCAYVPNNYYLLVNKTGTLTSTNNIIAMAV